MHSSLHSIQIINTESKIEERTLVITLQLSFMRSWEAKRAPPDWHHCDACRPFDATEKNRQVSEQPVAYHRINILQRKDDTDYSPHWYDTEIRHKSGPGLKGKVVSVLS
jgi:hypothetical protein